MNDTTALTDTQTLRAHARANVEDGAVTTGYAADRAAVLALLDEALATELVSVLRYRRHYFMARGIHSQSVAQEFLDHSNEEQGRAEYAEGDTLASMIREDLVAERIAIDSYRDIIAYLGDQDPTTRRLVEGILAVEEQHADELADLLVAFPPSSLESTASGCSVQPVAVSSVARLA